MAKVDSWSEIGLCSISAQGGTETEFKTLIETVNVEFGEKGFDAIATIAGGRIVKFNPQEDTTITLEAYPVEAGTDSGAVGKGFFDFLHTADATQPITIPVDHTRTKYRMTLLWTDKADATIATSALATASTESGLRIVAAEGFFVKADPDFTDGVLKWNIEFKIPAFDKSASANVKVESTDGTADLAVVPAYTSSVKF